ncbi:hypothetical protein FRC15_008787 [Serendipita sp. 397]|nr:hypothetical protein FRC15_008787 [Serendipita sp. 397]
MLFRKRRASSISSSSPYTDDDGRSVYTTTSSDDSDTELTREREHRRRELLQQEWEEGVAQLQLIFVVVLMPWFGKYWGRKWAHVLHTRYLQLGLGKSFFCL